MRSLFASTVLALLVGGCTAPSDNVVPVHDSLLPEDGTVTEYWPNGSVRRERTYENGRIVRATERYRNGSVAYEVKASPSLSTKTVEKREWTVPAPHLPHIPEQATVSSDMMTRPAGLFTGAECTEFGFTYRYPSRRSRWRAQRRAIRSP